MKRKTILHLHISLAGLCLPFLIVYLITGILYTFGIKGDFVSSKETVSITQKFSLDQESIQREFTKILEEKKVKIPTGDITVRKAGTSWQAIWNGSDCEHILEPASEDNNYKLTLKHANWHRNLVQLHKAKGGMVFKIFAALMTLFVLSLFSLGLCLSLQSKVMRNEIGFSILLGTALLIAALMLS
ncbi:MAG: hypothetical protein H3C47_14210 [Candidatus Cloacimonetes bacterium]|nr:hypothetical protein [Candidatus Cloacimonadota bacterium]